MPIFEYRCHACGAQFEKIMNSAAAPANCKECGSPKVEKLLSVFAVAGDSRSPASPAPGPCGVCGAPRRGMCGD